MRKLDPSVEKITSEYFKSLNQAKTELVAFYFCDNEKDANECADLVLQNIKRATASSLWWYKSNNETLPQVGDRYIVTNWEGVALCVIEVEKVEITPFNKITAAFARREGEGDKSLAYWKKVHWDYYQRELANTKYFPSEDMPIVCEYFNVVFK